ncbi:MAG: helix-turn-helix domain-containing protein [Prevotellaceae bacterium]|jgi:transcriptional regulator with XRE-family HTH domain|nr:helix-turn-helix domain-containing protein [Prevotellaceae bacterium]
MNDIRQNIEEIRKEKGINQENLAEMLGIKQATFSGYLTRNKNLTYEKLLEIADKLEVSIIDLITHPTKYVPEKNFCNSCKEKDKTIENLNQLIETLNNKIAILQNKKYGIS